MYAYLIKPFKEEQISAAINVAYKRFAEEKKLYKEIASLKENLETRKIVEKAKGILMKKNNLSENEAYRHLQKQAMDKRCSLKEIAQAVILLFEEKINKKL